MLNKLITRLIPWRKPQPTVAVIRLSGVIASGGRLGSGLSIGSLATPLQRAFSLDPLDAVALVINSPGGSAAQSHLIFSRIRALAAEKKKPVFAFVEDVAASGGYMIACAADEIYADESSILGSIGVISSGFGFTELLVKLGVERRVHSAGEYKSSLDPFKPENPEDVARLEAIQRDVHQQFISLVKTSRGPRLRGAEGELYTGEFWAGRRSLELGLIDGIGDIRTVLRAKFGDKVRLVPIGPEKSFLRRRLGLESLASAFHGASLAEEGLAQLEARSLWSRFGL